MLLLTMIKELVVVTPSQMLSKVHKFNLQLGGSHTRAGGTAKAFLG